MKNAVTSLSPGVCLSILCFFSLIFVGNAQTIYTGPANGDWFNALNWSAGVPETGKNALIPGGAAVTISSQSLTASFNVDNFGTITLEGVTLTNLGAIYSGGTFINNGTILNQQTFQNFGTLTCSGSLTNSGNFVSGGPWTIGTGATFINTTVGSVYSTGAVTNNGTIENHGVFGQGNGFINHSLFKNFSGATFNNNFGADFDITNTGSIVNEGNIFNDGTISNTGVVNNNGSIRNNVLFKNLAAFDNQSGAQLQNYGTFENEGNLNNTSNAAIQNFANLNNKLTLNNAGSIDNSNTITNLPGATCTNLPGSSFSNQFGSTLNNAGNFSHQSQFNSNGGINNTGVFINQLVLNINIGSVVNNTGTFTNNGTLTNANTINNDGTFQNTSIVNNSSGGIINNNLILNNSIGAVINNNYELYNKLAANFNNNGVINNDVRWFVEGGSVSNNGYIRSSGDIFLSSGALLTNLELLEITEGNLKNEGSITNSKMFKITACASLKNTGSIQNNATIEHKGILFQYGTITGNAIQTISGYVQTNPVSSQASICQPVTVSVNFDGDAKVYANSMIQLGGSNNCNSLVYRANGVARPVWHCADVGSIQQASVVVTTRIGDSLTCVSNIAVVDSIAPVFDFCPAPIQVQTVTSTTPVSWNIPTATDNCTSVTMNASHQPGFGFSPGSTAVTYTATDLYGRSNECQFTVTVQQVPGTSTCTGDTSGPDISGCPANQNIITPGYSATATWIPPVASDNCLPVSITGTSFPGATFQIGNHAITYTAKDGNNNTSVCNFNIQVVQETTPCISDNISPVISGCPANQFLLSNASTNGAYATWSAPAASDNCGPVSLTASVSSGSFFATGTTPVIYTATDQSNNTKTCQFSVTVGTESPCPGDISGPVFSNCPANIQISVTGNSAVANWTAPSVSDACDPVIVNNNYNSGTVFPLGVTTVSYLASDRVGNTSQCTFDVSVQNICDNDATNPVITGCPGDVFVPTTANAAVASWTTPTATDNCTLQSFNSNYLPGVTLPVGTTIVVYTATDARGNVSNCNFNVTVANAPDCTTNSIPAANATGVSPASVALSWSPAANATAYDVYLGTSNPPTTLVGANITASTFTMTNLLGNTTYSWYVVPKNPAGLATGCASSSTKFITSAAVCNSCSGNLLTNPCFNDGLTGYTFNGANIVSTGAYEGTYAAEICSSNSFIQTSAAANSGWQYVLKFHARVENINTCANVKLEFLNSAGTLIGTVQTATVNSLSYQQYSLTGISPANTASIRITAAKCGSTGCLLIDNLCLNGSVYCDNITNGGTISGTQPTNCGPFDAPVINSNVLPTGGTGTIDYIWKSSTTSCPTATSGTIILGANNANFDPPFTTQTTYFTRLARRSGCTSYVPSNCVTYTVTTDNTTPVINNCPTGQTVNAVSGCGTATWITPTATDNCGTPNLTSNYNSGFCFPAGNTTVIYTATDAAGNSKTCSFIITVGANDNFCKGLPGTGLTRQVWNNISGASVSNLTSNVNYPNNPNSTTLNTASVGPVNIADNYGTRVRGYITPTTSGNYTFYVYGDDETQLFLSTNNQSVNKVMIANVPGWTYVAQLNKYTTQVSTAKNLIAGQDYYVELLQKEQGGGDHWGIYWVPPGSGTPVQIPLQFLAPISTACSPPSCATLVSPANNATGVNPASVVLTWNASATATAYDVYLSTSNPPATIVATGMTATSYTASNLSAGANYFWYVVPKNNNGSATGCNSGVYKFTTLNPCNNFSSGGTIGKVCLNGQVSLTSISLPSGGSGTIEYVWMKGTSSCDPASMTVIANSNVAALSVTPPATTTFYLRRARRSGCTDYISSNCIEVYANECSSSLSCTGNLISNFSFESGFTGFWNYNNTATISSDAFQGSKATKLCANGGVGISFNAAPGKTYAFKAYAKRTELPSYADFIMEFFDGNWNLIQQHKTPINTSVYTLYSIEKTAPAGTCFVQVFYWAGPNGCTYTDSWCLTETAAPCNSNVLLVVGNSNLNASDLAIKNRLTYLGYSVTLKQDNYSASSDANGRGCVIISESVESSDVHSKFRDVAVPVIVMEQNLYDDMKMTGTSSGSHFGTSTLSSLTVLSGHAIAAGVSTGNIGVYTSGRDAGWGAPSAAASIIAQNTNNSTRKHIFAYESGAAMVGKTAPSKRLGLFINDPDATYLTANGWKLFDNSVKWATGCNFVQGLASADIEVFEVAAYNELRKARIEISNNTANLNDYFILERLNEAGSFDAINFSDAGTSETAVQIYQMYDEFPEEGNNYYRVRLMLKDGSERVSDVRKVVFDGLSKVVAYPNPANNQITLDMSTLIGKEANIYLYDMRGVEKMRFSDLIPEDPDFQIVVSELPDGIYSIRISCIGKRDEIIPIVIQH